MGERGGIRFFLGFYYFAMFLCVRITDVSMLMGWYRMFFSSSVLFRDLIIYSASCRFVNSIVYIF